MESILTGIKIHKKNKNLLSFSDDGISVNILQTYNSSNKDKVLKNFEKLHHYIICKKYKVYICKDFFFKKKTFKKNYSQSSEFYKIKKKYDYKNLFSSDFFQRTRV